MPNKLHPQLIDLAAAVVEAGSLDVTTEDYDRVEDRTHIAEVTIEWTVAGFVAGVEIAHEGRTYPATMYEPPETEWHYEDGGVVVSRHIADVARHCAGVGFDLADWKRS